LYKKTTNETNDDEFPSPFPSPLRSEREGVRGEEILVEKIVKIVEAKPFENQTES